MRRYEVKKNQLRKFGDKTYRDSGYLHTKKRAEKEVKELRQEGWFARHTPIKGTNDWRIWVKQK